MPRVVHGRVTIHPEPVRHKKTENGVKSPTKSPDYDTRVKKSGLCFKLLNYYDKPTYLSPIIEPGQLSTPSPLILSPPH